MVRIISDTSTMYNTQQAREAGFAVSQLAVTIAGESYRELDEMTPARFVEIINGGNMPASSQPAIGEVMDLYEEFKDDEILNICMADGLSGTYASAAVAFIGKTIKLAPVMTLTEDCRRLTSSAIKRSFKQAIAHVGDELAAQEMGEGEGWRIYVVHGEAPEKAEQAKEILVARFPKADYVLSTLTPAFITQGGPGCVAVQSVKLL